ncbi:MAG: IPT/TIG domain-containing protein [Planctomycetales bacterium]|nr:IPT/TIG domain-containing protein [Planctomycetales bacterium]
MRITPLLGLAVVLAAALASGCSKKKHRDAAPAPAPAPAPTLSSIAPVSGPTTGGTTITLTGSNFQGGATVAVGGAAATSVVIVSGTSATAVTPAGSAGPANVTLTNPDGQAATLANGFTYVLVTPPAPTLTAVSPTSGPIAGGQTVTLTGTGFQTGASVTFGGTPATSVTVLSASSLTCVSPATGTPGAVNVTITNPDTQSATLTNGYTYVAPAPTLTAISPTSGPTAGGTAVTLTGTGFLSGATVTIGGAAATTVTVVSATTITATSPAGTAGPANVVVTNVDSQSATLAGGFTYVAPPALSSITPTSGSSLGGTVVTLSGSSFQAGATVLFGSSLATSVTVTGTTTITCTTPGGTGTVSVTVTNPDGQASSLSSAYTYVVAPPPSLSSISPTSGPTSGGQTVTLTGTDFAAGATVLLGGNLATSVVVTGTTTITCTTPVGTAGAVNVTVTNTDAQNSTLTNGYTYVSGPTVASVSPGSGDVSGGTPVTITGTGFASGATVQFGTSAATSVVVVSATTITCLTPSGSAGAVTVTVTNPGGGSGSLPSGYTYTTGGTIPSVSSVSPASGPSAGGTLVTISGSNFLSGAAATFGGVAATSVTLVNSSTLTAVVPRAAPGAPTVVSVTVTNTGGASGTLSNAFTYLPTPVESLSDTGADPDVAVDGSGRIHVVWRSTVVSSGATDILYVRSTDGGRTWTASPPSLPGSGRPVSRPRLAARGNTVMVVWNETVSGNEHISHTYSSDGGGTWSSPGSLLNNGTQTPDPDVSLDGNGRAIVAYHYVGTSPWGGTMPIRTIAGTPGGTFGSPVLASSFLAIAGPPSVSADGNGQVLVAWGGGMNGPVVLAGTDVWSNRSTDGAATYGTAINVSSNGGLANSINPSIALSGSAAVIAWEGDQLVGPTTAYFIRATGSTDGGASWGSNVTVSTGAVLLKTDAVVAADGSGAFQVAWREQVGASSNDEAHTARTTDNGQNFSTKVNLSNNTGASVTPAVAAGAGTFVIHVWADDTASSGTFDVLSY